MAQLTLYLPDDVAERLRAEARRAKKSLSAFVVERLSPERSSKDARRERLAALYGSATLPEAADDPPPDEVEGL